MKRAKQTPAELRLKARESLKRKALRTLKRARLAAEVGEAPLTEWEGDFLGSVEARVQTYGRAFADPEKGGSGSAFSTLQMRKLKEIGAKINGDPPAKKGRVGFRRRDAPEPPKD